MPTPETTAALIARDPALPLATLLDDDALGAWLSPAAPVPLRRRYLRYKPGASCVALAETVRDGVPTWVAVTGVAAEAHAKTAKALTHARVDELVAAEPDAGLVAVMPSADRHLPGLRSLLREPDAMVTRLLRRDVAVERVSALAYKPHRRWVGRVDLRDGTAALVRAYRSGHASAHAATLETLRSVPAPVPELLGHRARRDLLALRWVPGDVLDGVVRAPLSAAAHSGVTSAGAALARLHGTAGPQPGTPWHPASLGGAAEAVGVLVPGLAGVAALLAARLVDELPEAPIVLAHGDFSLDQVVVGPAGPSLLDLDRLGPAPAGLDLGTAAAALLADPGRAHLAGEVLDALLTGYGEHARVPSSRELEIHTAAALLTRAVEPFRQCEPEWPELIARNLHFAHAVLEHGFDASLREVSA